MRVLTVCARPNPKSFCHATNLSLGERRIQRAQFSGLGFLGSCFSLFSCFDSSTSDKKGS